MRYSNFSSERRSYVSLLRSFCIAFGLYSKIPMPKFEWNPKDMRYTMCFFPLISIPIALLVLLWFYFCQWLHIHSFLFACVITAIPVLVTGGIHLDGYCDTVDALSSRQPREKKLEILKDPHLGAFAVIYTFAYMLLYAGASCEFAARAEGSARLLPVLFMTMERAFSGLSVLSFPSAKKDGLAASFAQAAEKKTDRMGMMLWPLATGAVSWLLGGLSWLLAAAVFFVLLLILFVWFYRWSKKQFGGITGDLAGFYLQAGELVCLIAALVLAGWVSNNVGG